jgi:hypothetical protein
VRDTSTWRIDSSQERLHVVGAKAVADRLQRFGIGGAGKPVLKLREADPVATAWRLTHSSPLSQTFPGHGAYVQSLMKPGPNSGSRM